MSLRTWPGGHAWPVSWVYRAEVRTLLRHLGRAVGLPDGLAMSLSPHSMRHAFHPEPVDAGASLRDLQDATRHYDRGRGNLDRSSRLPPRWYISRLPAALGEPG